MRHFLLALAIAAPVAAAPVPTGPANVPEFTPAFAGQTRAPAVTSQTKLAVTEIATGLNKPWGLAFLPDGRMLVSEKAAGTLRIIAKDGTKSAPVTGTPKTDARDQLGMMGVAAPGDGYVYWSYAEPRDGGNGLAVARGKLGGTAAAPAMSDVKVIFRMMPTLDSTKHAGGRLIFPKDGTLFVTLGERSDMPGRVQAQDLGSHFGKIVRINRDGTVPRDNPYLANKAARPEIWSKGHRNILSAALDDQGRLWDVEMGPKGGDELNLVMRGRDYGWPTISYGEEYSGKPIGKGITKAAGMEQPVYYWDPVISPSGMTIYSGSLLPEWRGNVFIGGLSSKALVRLVLKEGRVAGEERLLTDRGERIRDVVQGPDGALYLLTDDADGKLLRVAPAA
ncbi:PQQ-dependent sugar dehydrogenase [Polymorphobacter fuscus]|uniref:PQQ-dependent sugar dehydrogenase n=1 Tax=Sandarakinorhabdus fusca TaxID=1439888 RepID=A0A7C9KH32_9SPHN|nr:PQQ-dependent sugar dehydrogenase [Polymorphobacter fuscus]KAB7648966.1 PQQ-dependent sugar dehydrogenase [Polymorphobacter fuscus]MQT16560.1 PQQ-dependent sugar dehydrogenase [Polymorphobacter fuscus]NJC07149.1 glucose/arabinose dehydrogenase [Polymorphobacter fuscus]